MGNTLNLIKITPKYNLSLFNFINPEKSSKDRILFLKYQKILSQLQDNDSTAVFDSQ